MGDARARFRAFDDTRQQILTRLWGVRCALNRWPAFTLFLEDGRVAIDNSIALARSPGTVTKIR